MSNRRDVQAIIDTAGCIAIALSLVVVARLVPGRPDDAAWLVWLRIGLWWLAVCALCYVFVRLRRRAFARGGPSQ